MGIAVCTIENYFLHNHQLHHQLLLVFLQLATTQVHSAINGQSIAYFDDGKVPLLQGRHNKLDKLEQCVGLIMVIEYF